MQLFIQLFNVNHSYFLYNIDIQYILFEYCEELGIGRPKNCTMIKHYG
jgi:hypothetical protein